MPEVQPVACAPDGQVGGALVLSDDIGDDTVVAAEILVEDAVDGVDVGIVGRSSVLDHPFLAGLKVFVIPVEVLNHTARVNLERREK